MQRDYGYYWVKLDKEAEWKAGQYLGGFSKLREDGNGWLITGYEGRWDSDELAEIGERIPDNELLQLIYQFIKGVHFKGEKIPQLLLGYTNEEVFNKLQDALKIIIP